MRDYVIAVTLLFELATAIGCGLWAVVTAFRCGIGWGLCYLFVPVVGSWVTWFFNRDRMMIPFVTGAVAALLFSLTLSAVLRTPDSRLYPAVKQGLHKSGVPGSRSGPGLLPLIFDIILGKPAGQEEPSPVAAVSSPEPKVSQPRGGLGLKSWDLTAAVRADQPQVIRALLKSGAPVNQAGAGGMTPLMEAAAYGYEDAAAVLLEYGADENLRSEESKTAADYARENGRTAVLEFLNKQK